MFHRTERLLLRPPWAEDWAQVYNSISDEGIVRNLASAPWPYSAADARKFVNLPIQSAFPRFLIARADNATLIGCIGIDPTDDGVELGYWIARSHWGRGYATEAGRAVIEIAAMLGHERLVASHFLDNPASGKVLEKLGFAPTGTICERHSCGRGESSTVRQYALALGAASALRAAVQPQAA